MMDDGSRFLKISYILNSNRESIIKESWVGKFSIPHIIVTGNHQQFKGEFSDVSRYRIIFQNYTAPYSPVMSAVERVYGALMNKLIALRYSLQKPWAMSTYCISAIQS
eukprot:NODE_903_length_3231_cov_0.607280.p2 type:complete len:108 gc:universal NODE_903_length_3231_cov_0.607280:1759-1436(-)